MAMRVGVPLDATATVAGVAAVTVRNGANDPRSRGARAAGANVPRVDAIRCGASHAAIVPPGATVTVAAADGMAHRALTPASQGPKVQCSKHVRRAIRGSLASRGSRGSRAESGRRVRRGSVHRWPSRRKAWLQRRARLKGMPTATTARCAKAVRAVGVAGAVAAVSVATRVMPACWKA